MAVSEITGRRLRETPLKGYSPDSQTAILELRLIEGERQIAMAEERGSDTTRLIDFWIDLLHQYERSVDAFDRAA